MLIWVGAVVILLVLFYWAVNFILLYHLSRFGVGTQPKRIAGVFLFGSILLFAAVSTTFSALNIPALITHLSTNLFHFNV